MGSIKSVLKTVLISLALAVSVFVLSVATTGLITLLKSALPLQRIVAHPWPMMALLLALLVAGVIPLVVTRKMRASLRWVVLSLVLGAFALSVVVIETLGRRPVQRYHTTTMGAL